VCRRPERGVALLAAVVALATMTVLATGLAHTSAVDRHLAANALAALQADALARSGVAVAAVVLAETGSDDAIDTLAAPWARPSGRQPLGAGWVEVTVEDEARRLDLDVDEMASALPRLLHTLGLDPAIAGALAAWKAAGAVPALAEDVPARRPARVDLRSVGELRLVPGVTPAALARLRPYVTVAGEPAVNPNTASPAVLAAVVGDALAARLIALRTDRPIDPARDLPALLPSASPEQLATVTQQLTARGSHYTVRAVAGVGEMRRAVEATLEVVPGAAPVVRAWQPRRPEG
jgi:general secretion pathway protein K